MRNKENERIMGERINANEINRNFKTNSHSREGLLQE